MDLIILNDGMFHLVEVTKEMMEHIQRFNDHNINFLVFGRKVGKKFISLNKINVPKIIEDRCTGFEEDSFRDDISSTELRLTQNN